MPDVQQNWYSVRCLFGRTVPPDPESTYEERITLWRAADFDEAIALAEAEAIEYASMVETRYLDYAEAYHLFDDVGHGAEVFSQMRDSSLSPDDYVERFFDTGAER